MSRTKTIIAGIITMIIIIVLVILATSTPGGQPAPETKISATIFPIYDIAKNIAGDKAEVVLITPPGASPHTFELTAEQIRKLQGTDVMFAVGHGLDDWITTARNAIPGSQIRDVSQGVILLEFGEDKGVEARKHEEETENSHSHEGVDPHYWLSIENAEKIAKNISQALIEIDPNNAAVYLDNTNNYIGQLRQAKEDMEQTLDNLEDRRMITMHNAWNYFAREFDLEIVDTFEPAPGKEPTARDLAELSKLTQEYNINIFFSEPQMSNQVLKPFLEDFGIELAILDPLGGLEDRDSYIKMMEYNAQTIHQNLK